MEGKVWCAYMRMRIIGASLLGAFLVAPGSAPAQLQTSGDLNVTQAAPPISVAPQPEEYSRLVRYFQELAAQEQALAESYSRMAKTYPHMTPPSSADRVAARQMTAEYKRLADIETKAAASAAAIATYHGQMAKVLGHPPAGPKRPNPGDTAFRR